MKNRINKIIENLGLKIDRDTNLFEQFKAIQDITEYANKNPIYVDGVLTHTSWLIDRDMD